VCIAYGTGDRLSKCTANHLSSTRWTSRSSPYGASSAVRSASVALYAKLRRNRRPVSAMASPASLASVTCGAGPAAAPDAARHSVVQPSLKGCVYSMRQLPMSIEAQHNTS